MVLWFYGSMVLWFCDSMNAIANCWLLWFYGSVILWMQLLIAGCYVNSFGDRLWDFRGSMWIFLDLCEFFWVIVCGIFVALCVSSVIYVNSFGWSSMEFSGLCVNLPWSMWILLGDRLWNFCGSMWIFRDLCEFFWVIVYGIFGDLCEFPWSVWILCSTCYCLVVVICVWPFRLSSSV